MILRCKKVNNKYFYVIIFCLRNSQDQIIQKPADVLSEI